MTVSADDRPADDRYIRMVAVDNAIELRMPGEPEEKTLERADRIAKYIMTGAIKRPAAMKVVETEAKPSPASWREDKGLT